MSIPLDYVNLQGEWNGANRLHLPWMTENPVQESNSLAKVGTAAGGKFLSIEYDWTFEGQSQDGILLLSQEKESSKVSAVWLDSWHNGDKFMSLAGTITNNLVELKGFYSVPDHPDWGWRLTILPGGEGSLKIEMFNVAPEGEEMLAVEWDYRRLS
jgi:hypothetical protein